MANTIINIGRQFGSGGKEVAMLIGEKLGIKVYDNELISKAAEESGFSKDFFNRCDEKRSIFSISSFFAGVGAGAGAGIGGTFVNDNDLFKIQSTVIRGIAEKEPAVIIGRCSDYILRDMECLDVFITAPDDFRLRRITERLNIDEEDAEKLISRQDKTRETYYNYFTYGDWGVASNYDLCVDSSILGIEGTADFIIDFGRKAGLIKL
jgi:cytidylate kinase